MVEVRKRDGKVTQVIMDCKQRLACEHEVDNNFDYQNPMNSQCRPATTNGPSVCRQCCEVSNCTKDFNPLTMMLWNKGPQH